MNMFSPLSKTSLPLRTTGSTHCEKEENEQGWLGVYKHYYYGQLDAFNRSYQILHIIPHLPNI